jgi:hypothetical protein
MAGEGAKRRQRPRPEPHPALRLDSLAKSSAADGTGPRTLWGLPPGSAAARTEHRGPR